MVPIVNRIVVNVEVVQYVTRSVESVHQDVNSGGLLIFVRLLSVSIGEGRIKN